jgi:endonuclease/exonuclease/phosphatase family metal-dependent hydrolase
MFGKLIIKWFMLVINLVAVMLLLLSLLGSVLSPEISVYPAYLTLIFPIIIGMNMVFVVFWILAKKWLFLISLSVLFLSAAQLKDHFPVHLGQPPKGNATHPIHILTYNTRMSGKLVKQTKTKPNAVMQYVLDADADIVCLQEFMVSSNNEYITHADMLRIFKKYPYKHIEYKLKLKTKSMGIATLSKYPIINKQTIKYPSFANLSIYSDININGKIIRLVNNHLESNRITENDKALPIRLKDNFDAENLTEITLHFSRKLGVAYKLRAQQADVVASVIAASPYNVIVCGDFNDVPTSYAYNKVKGRMKDAFSETSTGLGWTYYQHSVGFRIDYILYDPESFTPVKYKMDKVTYSDHYPVWCEMNIEPNISN